jgi:PRC-barrel domain
VLRSLKTIQHYAISATDSEIGKVEDFLFDDERWTLRYLVADTGGFLGGRRVLISPLSFRHIDWATRRFHLALTTHAITNSPPVDLHRPISRQHELNYYRYYNYPLYWGVAGVWGVGEHAGMVAASAPDESSTQHSREKSDTHLRSAAQVFGYHIQGTDDAIGHVEDFIIDDETWEIRYLIVDTSNWWFGKRVLIAPLWADRISWTERKVYLGMSRQAIKDCPEWNSDLGVNREYEARLYDYYGRPLYWAGGSRPGLAKPAHI